MGAPVTIVDRLEHAVTDANPLPVTLPPDVYSSTVSGVRRVLVDNDQTGFYEKRDFRTFKEWSQPASTQIASGATYVVRIVTPVNVIITQISFEIDNGHIRVQTVVGGTAGGTFAEVLPIFNRNNMTEAPPASSSALTITAGGTHTGGTILDTLRLKVENSSGSSSTVGVTSGDERGISPNTYYIRVSNIGTGVVEGVMRAIWEERP